MQQWQLLAAALNNLGNAAIQQTQVASKCYQWLKKKFLHSKEVEQELDFVSEEIKSKKFLDSFNVRRKKARFALISNMSNDLNEKLEHSNKLYLRTTDDDIPESIGDNRNDFGSLWKYHQSNQR